MSKQTSQILCAGQLKGTTIKIKSVRNDGLQESVVIINQGTVVQPMSGWVLASLRGQSFFLFPDDLLFEPGMSVMILSGQQELKKQCDPSAWVTLLWKTDQIWNNHGDTAILFDANDLEIDRYSYPHERVMGSSANGKKILQRSGGGFEIISASPGRINKKLQKQNGALKGQFAKSVRGD